jgi:hypothetical protein
LIEGTAFAASAAFAGAATALVLLAVSAFILYLLFG